VKVVDLFCGAGGFSLGFDYVKDFDIIYGIDSWSTACKSFHANFPDAEIDNRNALETRPSEIPKADVIIGSPPCQDFSSATMKNREPDLSLVNWFLSVVEYHKPEFWILENVPPLSKYLSHPHKVYRMNDYGVPQIRKRLFDGVYNEPRKEQIPLAFPAVLALESRWKSSAYVDKKLPRKYPRNRGIGASSAFRRLCLIPEAKLIQTFPLDFIVYGSLKEQYTQIGNAVPPLMAYHLAESLVNPQQQKIA